MTYDFSKKTALVTGAASGIGAATAKALAASNVAKLILVDINETPLEAFDFDCETEIHTGSVADEALWDGIEAAGGTIDLAALNAGIPGDGAPIAKMTFANWRRVMDVNLDGAFLSLRTAIRMAQKGSSIVLTSSVTAVKPEVGIAHYASSKAAVKHLTKIAAKECVSRGIRVNAIAPGGTDTGIWDRAPFFEELVEKHQGDRAGAIATMAQQATPMGRFATSEEMAGQIMFLLSDVAAFTTGSTLVSDGGFRL